MLLLSALRSPTTYFLNAVLIVSFLKFFWSVIPNSYIIGDWKSETKYSSLVLKYYTESTLTLKFHC